MSTTLWPFSAEHRADKKRQQEEKLAEQAAKTPWIAKIEEECRRIANLNIARRKAPEVGVYATPILSAWFMATMKLEIKGWPTDARSEQGNRVWVTLEGKATEEIGLEFHLWGIVPSLSLSFPNDQSEGGLRQLLAQLKDVRHT